MEYYNQIFNSLFHISFYLHFCFFTHTAQDLFTASQISRESVSFFLERLQEQLFSRWHCISLFCVTLAPRASLLGCSVALHSSWRGTVWFVWKTLGGSCSCNEEAHMAEGKDIFFHTRGLASKSGNQKKNIFNRLGELVTQSQESHDLACA